MLRAARHAVIWACVAGPLAVAAAGTDAPAKATLVALPQQPAGVPWPTEAWPTGAPPDGVAAALATAFERARPGETRAAAVVWQGRLVAERYAPGFRRDTPFVSWSMAKSVTHALLGIAARLGLVDVDRPMGNPRWAAGDARAAIPWRQWINMVDGQDYHEIGADGPARNDAARMLFGEGRLDVAGFAASLPLAAAPGARWNYNSAGVNLVADGLGRAFAPAASARERRARVAAALREELFAPLGMRSAQPEFDAAGTFIGSSLVYASAPDWARFGLLYLRDGVWAGRRILPPGWVDFARTPTPAPNCDIYGAGFWITPAAGRGRPFEALAPDGPRDIFSAQGYEGQLVVLVPSKDLILVRLGVDRDGWSALTEWVARMVALFPDVAR